MKDFRKQEAVRRGKERKAWEGCRREEAVTKGKDREVTTGMQKDRDNKGKEINGRDGMRQKGRKRKRR